MTADSFILRIGGMGPGPAWSCSTVDDDGKLLALIRHGRWTGILRMAERSSGRDRFGEPRWERQADGRHNLVWPCTLCGCAVQVPAHHTERSCLALLESRFSVSRANAYGPF
jgi:hypothetical protein